MAFYTFVQNNSGGGFDYDGERGISQYVIIEADDYIEANDRADAIGLYFDGVDRDKDCDCCGDRWYAAEESDARDVPKVYGTEVTSGWETATKWMGKQPHLFIHFADADGIVGFDGEL